MSLASKSHKPASRSCGFSLRGEGEPVLELRAMAEASQRGRPNEGILIVAQPPKSWQRQPTVEHGGATPHGPQDETEPGRTISLTTELGCSSTKCVREDCGTMNASTRGSSRSTLQQSTHRLGRRRSTPSNIGHATIRVGFGPRASCLSSPHTVHRSWQISARRAHECADRADCTASRGAVGRGTRD